MNNIIIFYILRKVLAWTFGTMLIVGGLAGLILPIIPGIVLIFAGLAFLARHSEKVQNMKFVKRFVLREK